MRPRHLATATERKRLAGWPIDEVAFGVEVIVHVGVDRSELMKRLHSSEGEMAVLGSTDLPPSHILAVEIIQLS